MFALFASCTQYSAVLHCAAGQITLDTKARHHTIRAAFLSLLANVAVAVAVVLLVIFIGITVLKNRWTKK